jgi:hypothetical protein
MKVDIFAVQVLGEATRAVQGQDGGSAEGNRLYDKLSEREAAKALILTSL